MKKLEIANEYERQAFKIIDADVDYGKRVDEFENICNRVLEHKDPVISLIFLKRTSWICSQNPKYYKALNVPAHEKIVVRSGDEELMYMFARDVYGANLKNITFNMPKKSYLRKELEKDMRPIGEYSL